MMRRLARSLVCAMALAGCAGPGAHGIPGISSISAVRPAAALNSKIQHVIVVVLENRSFDNIFVGDAAALATFHASSTINGQPVDVDSTMTASSNGQPTPLVPQTLSASSYDCDHSHQGFLAQYDGGKNDGFATGSSTCYGYVPAGEIPPYYDIAAESAISDRFFHGVTAPTFPSHLEMGAATTFGVIGNPSSNAWGCDSPPGTVTDLYDPNATGQVDAGKGPFPCFDDLSIFDLMDRASPQPVSWKYYVAPEGNDITGNLNIAAYFRHIRYGPDWNNDIAANDGQVLTDLAGGTLPQVSFVIPNDTSTDHAGTPSLGPTYIKTLVNAFGASQYYNNTLMIITWDDWGGWYDHVPPPQRADGSQLSFRKPVLFVGGYVKHKYCSHVVTEDASIAKTIEEIYGLGTLGEHDTTTNSFDDVIDVTQTPPAFVPITSNQGSVVPGPIPTPIVLDKTRHTEAGPSFRVIPANFMRPDPHGNYPDTRHDYYGSRSADY